LWCKKMNTAANGTSAAMREITTTLHAASLNRACFRAARPPSPAGLTTGLLLLPYAGAPDDDVGPSRHSAFTTSPQSLRLWSNALAGNRRSALVPGTSPWRKL
jgi:hypothetical protein